MANTFCPKCELNEKYIEMFIEFVTKKLPGNAKRIIRDKNKLKNRILN
jgi:hypothetical protein